MIFNIYSDKGWKMQIFKRSQNPLPFWDQYDPFIRLLFSVSVEVDQFFGGQ